MTAACVRVVKIGGEVIRGARLEQLCSQLAHLVDSRAGRDDRVVLVHGGGPQTSELQRALGQTPVVVGGRRVTDEAALQAIKYAVAGGANVDLCAGLVRVGLSPVGLHGASSAVIRAVKRPPRIVTGAGPEPVDFGHVGDVVGVNRDLLEHLLSGGYVPVLACLGVDAAGRVYNINADIVATRVAVELGARDLFLVMDAPGVLRDRDDPASRIARLTIAEAEALIADGTVAGGMIPKLEESFVALRGGVERVHLLADGLDVAAANPGSVGSLLTA